MLTATMLVFDGTGRIRRTNGSSTGSNNGGTPTNVAGVLVVLDKAPDVFNSGCGYDLGTGSLCATVGSPTSFHQGMPFEATGKVCTDNVGAITSYLGGLPRTANGSLAVAALE